MGLGGLAFYGRGAVLAAVGHASPEIYLKEKAPDYELAQAINQMLTGSANSGRALVFFRHQYYLNVSYVNGDPATSFEVDPSRLDTPEAWARFLKEKRIAYVVRTPDYPVAIASPLRQLEEQGELTPFRERRVGNLTSMRIEARRLLITPVIILRVNGLK